MTATPGRRPLVSLVATARPTFAVDVARQRAEQARDLLVALGADVVGPDELVMTPEDVEAARALIDLEADLVVNLSASFSDAGPALALYGDLDRPVLLWSVREPGPVGDRLWLNSLCGVNLFGHALALAGTEVRTLHGDPDEPAVREALARALAGDLPEAPSLPTAQRARGDAAEAEKALAGLRGRRIGVVGDAPTGFTPSEYDPHVLRSLFGVEVERLEIDEAFEATRAEPEDAVATELADALAQRPSLAGLDPEKVALSAAVTSALRGWSGKASLSAVAVRCWPEFPAELGVCPCTALSRLADEGTPTTCERDVHGALTMLLLEALGSGTTYLVDTVDLDASQGLVRLWHCGSAATALAADPAAATQDVHCNRRIGVTGNFALRTGPVVLARLTENPAGPGPLRLLIASGESVPEPNRFMGNTAAVRLDSDAETFVRSLATAGFPHHTVLAWTDVRPGLRAAADLLDIPVTEF